MTTMNDIVLTEQLINIPIHNATCSADVRRNDLDEALKAAKHMKNRSEALCLRLRQLGAKDAD